MEQLNLTLTDEQVSLVVCYSFKGALLITNPPQIKDVTAKIKELADVRTQSLHDVDTILRVYHSGIQSGVLAVGQKEALDRLLLEHREAAVRDRAESEKPQAVAAAA